MMLVPNWAGMLILLFACSPPALEALRLKRSSGGDGQNNPDLTKLRPEIDGTEIEGPKFWRDYGRSDIDRAYRRLANVDLSAKAKNVILFVGDGMGAQTVTAARIFKGQNYLDDVSDARGEGEELFWERFPAVGLSKTYNTDFQVADSAGTATAIFSGVKTRMGVIGVDATVARNSCDATAVEDAKIKGMLHWAADAGKKTGFVTTARVTHATPSSLYAHSSDRNFESDADIGERDDAEGCNDDIAKQLIYSEAGRGIKVIFGGGRRNFLLANDSSEENPGKRADEDLTEAYQRLKEEDGVTYRYLETKGDLEKWMEDEGNTEYVMGLFSPSHMSYEIDRNDGAEGQPSLSQLTEAAVKHLQSLSDDNGFFLMVESGRIDHAHHDTNAKRALAETVEFEKAVKAAVSLVDISDTLVIVTADHSHAMTINGYPARGNPLLGSFFVDPHSSSAYPNGEKLAYATLSYANGPGYHAHFTNNSEVPWRDMREVEYNDNDFLNPAMVPGPEGYETHGGEDVPIYAIGPMSYLLTGVHEQSYIAHVMAYSACVGEYKDDCPRVAKASANKSGVTASLVIFVAMIPIMLF